MAEPAKSGMQIACEMADMAARMVEARYRREHPEASDDEVRAHIRAWWSDRPGAPYGDAAGRPVPVDRFA